MKAAEEDKYLLIDFGNRIITTVFPKQSPDLLGSANKFTSVHSDSFTDKKNHTSPIFTIVIRRDVYIETKKLDGVGPLDNKPSTN